MRFPATLDMVRARIPHVAITDTSEPSSAQVQDRLEEFDNDVYFAVGTLASLEADPSKAGFVQALYDQAARVVAVGTASVVWQSKFPEGVDPQDGTSYGSALWNRYKAMLANLQSAALRGTDAPSSETAPSAGPAWSPPGLYPLPVAGGGRSLFVDVIDPNPDYPADLSPSGCR